jgi:acyl-CoA synthetase (NDP forming)
MRQQESLRADSDMSTGGRPSHRQDLTPLLHARSVAIVGISQPGRFGGILAQNLAGFGYKGPIYGVNPRYESLYDRPCYPSLRDLPERPDLALLAVPNSRLLKALEEVAECRIPAAVIFANAHSDPADGEPSLQAQIKQLARDRDLVVCGPNCMGFLAPGQGLAVTGYPTNPDTPGGNVTLVSHSGSVWESFVQNKRGVAFNYIVSTGNEMVTTVADVMQFALADETTEVIGLYLETVRDPETFTAALAEAADRDIPIVTLKTGRSERGAQLAQAHTGALAGEDGAYDALFERYGVRRARSIDELMDTLELFAAGMRTRTKYVSALLDSGGQRALMVDLAEAEGVEFAPISNETEARLAEILEPGLDPVNPLDAWGTGNNADDIYLNSLLALDADPSTGMTLFAVDLYPLDDEDSFYTAVVDPVRDKLRNPLAFMGHLTAVASEYQTSILRRWGIPCLMGTETGLRAARHVLEYSAYQRERNGSTAEQTLEAPRPENRSALREQIRDAAGPLGEHASKQILEAYGLTATREIQVDTLDDALSAAQSIGYPIALKTCADLHKTERGGVQLGLASDESLTSSYRDFEARLGPQVLVQQMVPSGTELILGIVNDPQFGPMLTLGTGGIFVEVLKDVSMLTLPTRPEIVHATLMRLRGAALLKGARGRPPADVSAVVGAAMGLATLAGDLGEWIAEIDVNPLIALPDRAVVVDALIVPKASG